MVTTNFIKLKNHPEFAIVAGEQLPKNQQPLTPKADPTLGDGVSDKVASWGAANDFPQMIEKQLALNPDLGPAINWKARALYATGINYWVVTQDENGERVQKRGFVPEIEDFLEKNWMYPIQAVIDFYKLYNVFPVAVLSKDRKKINRLYAQTAAHCRYSEQDSSGRINNVHISANWPDPKDVTKLPMLDLMFDDIEDIRTAKDYRYVLPVSYPTGKVYYQLAHWDTVRTSGWLDLANKIPAYKLAILKNQMSIKYLIEMPDWWMPEKHKGFEKMTTEKQRELFKAEADNFSDFLTGELNAGKSITVIARSGKLAGNKDFAGWKITSIEDKLREGAYKEDSAEATTKFYSALEIDPSLAGIIPGAGGTNRNGSDKREALNIYMSLVQTHVDIILRPYYQIARYNGWDKLAGGRIVWGFGRPILQTLDEVTPSKRETVSEQSVTDAKNAVQ